MTTEPQRALLDHRLIIVTGKGGTGKTTVATAAALAAAAAGKRVVLAELGDLEHIPRLLVSDPPPVGYEGKELRPGLTVMRIDPFDALADYLGLQLGMRAPVKMALRSRAFRQFLEATPGWRELISLGKIWHLEQTKNEDGSPTWDLIVVDAPATGHGLTLLDVPRVVASAVRRGPLHGNAIAVEELIRDAKRTLLLPVALAEELPARETAELTQRVQRDLSIAIDRVVVNGIAPAPFPRGLEDLDRRLAGLPDELPGLQVLPPPQVLSACASLLASRYELNHSYAEQIERDTRLPVVPLPYLDGGLCRPTDVDLLARILTAAPEERARYGVAASLEAARVAEAA